MLGAEIIDWALGWIVDDLESKSINRREKGQMTEYDLVDRKTKRIIGIEEFYVSGVSGNMISWKYFTEPTTLRKNFRKRIGIREK